MNNIVKSIAAFVVSLFFLYSCQVEEGQRSLMRTEIGFLTYGITTDKVISPHLSALDNVLKIDEYITAPTEAEKIKIEDKFFRQYKFRFSGDTCRLIPDYATVVRDGKSIRTIGAKWSCSMTGFKDIQITCIAENKWRVVTNYTVLGEQIVSSCDLEVSASKLTASYAPEQATYKYRVSGLGSYTETVKTVVDYSRRIYEEQTTVYAVDFKLNNSLDAHLNGNIERNTSFAYYNGNLDMSLLRNGEKIYEPVKAALSPDPVTRIVQITYNNITEEWKL